MKPKLRSLTIAVSGMLMTATPCTTQQTSSKSLEQYISEQVRVNVLEENRGRRSVVPYIVLQRGQASWQNGVSSRREIPGPYPPAEGPVHKTVSKVGGISISISYEPLQARLVINEKDTLKIAQDSTLIVMIDRVDGIGGPPVVTGLSTLLLNAVAIAETRAPAESIDVITARFIATKRRDNNLTRFLSTIPAVREFIR